MPYRFWYAIVTLKGKEHRIGPYPTRRTAERKARELFKGASVADVSVVYDVGSRGPLGSRY